jgi:single-strand DNA-binding protein
MGSMNMSTINRQTLVGTLDADAEGRAMASGDAVVNLRLVTYDQFRDRTSGELKDVPEYHRVAVFGQHAEDARHLKKGAVVCVEGRTKTRKYQSNGQDRYITEVLVSGLNGRCIAMGQPDGSDNRPAPSQRRGSAPTAPATGSSTSASAWDEGSSDDDAPY